GRVVRPSWPKHEPSPVGPTWTCRSPSAVGRRDPCSTTPPVGFEGVERIVGVGAGLAGMHTVQALREQGYEGELVLLGAERRPPYDRPPLSTAVLAGKIDASRLPFDPETLRVDLRLGVRATGLADGVVRTDEGDIGYDGLVIATGSEPVRLPGE